MQFLQFVLFGVAYTSAGYNTLTGKIGFLQIGSDTVPTNVNLADMFIILNNDIVKGDILDCFVYCYADKSFATFKLTITENGVYPVFPKLEFNTEKRVYMVENGIVRMPADVISQFTLENGNKVVKAADFSGTLLLNNPLTDLKDETASITFLNPKNVITNKGLENSILFIFYQVANSAQLTSQGPIYFKSGSFKIKTLIGTLINGYPAFESALSNNNIDITIGDFSTSIYQLNSYSYYLNDPTPKYTQTTLLFTNNQSMPQDVVVKLVEGSNTYDAKRVDEYNYLIQGQFKAPFGSYTLKISQGQAVLDLPIKCLILYKKSLEGDNYYFNQVFLNLAFIQPDPSNPAEKMALIVFPKNITTVGKTIDTCAASTLNVTINNTLIFSEETINCTINVYITRSKVLQGFNLEWVWTQAGAVISSGKQKITGRITSDAYSVGGFVLTAAFMNQSYLTGGEVAAIVIGSVAFIYLVCVMVCCFCMNCKRCCYPEPQEKNIYQM